MDDDPRTDEPSVGGIGVGALVAGCIDAHGELLAVVADADDAWMRVPSRLAGWSRGHVLAHLAGNAESFVRLRDAASLGETSEQYPGGAPARDAAIAAGAVRASSDLIADLGRAIRDLEDRWSRTDPATWSVPVRLVSGATVPLVETVFRRWRETLVHTFDLDVGRGWHDWPSAWVRVELHRQKMAWTATRPMGLGALPSRALALDDRHRLAWLIGRASVEGLPEGPGL